MPFERVVPIGPASGLSDSLKNLKENSILQVAMRCSVLAQWMPDAVPMARTRHDPVNERSTSQGFFHVSFSQFENGTTKTPPVVMSFATSASLGS